MHPQNTFTATHIGPVNDNLPIKSPRPQQCGIQNVRPVSGGQQNNAFIELKTIHFHQQLVQGLLALVVASAQTGAPVPAGGAGQLSAERIVPHFVVTQLPVGLTGLVVAGVLAAAMSSLDSSLNAVATVGIVDVYRRHLAKGREDGHYLRMARALSCLASAGMILGALLLLNARTRTLQDATTTLIALTSGGLLGLYLLGFLTRRGDGRSAAVAIAATLALSLYRALSSAAWFPAGLRLAPLDAVNGYYTALLAHTLMFGVGWAAGLMLPRRQPDPQ